MEQPTFFQILLIFTLIFRHANALANSTTTPPIPESTLDPKQLKALQSLNIPTSKDPCSNPPILHNTTKCDTQTPFRHLISLRLINCSDDVSLSYTALKSLSTLQELTFINCPTPVIRFPVDLATNLRTFTCINSLDKLTGVWLSRLENITDLTVISVPIKTSGLYVILGNLNKLEKLTLSYANLTGFLPKSWHSKMTHIDLSFNQLKGKISSSITELESLLSLDLSANLLADTIPHSIGDLISLRNLSLSSNSLTGPLPESMASMPDLEYIDLSSNQLNGTIPGFLTNLHGLKHLNLEKNNFQGVMPFNMSFIKKLLVFKIGENANLCYNHSSFGSKMKLGLSPCDKNGFPVSPPVSPGPSGGDAGESGDDDGDSQDEISGKSGGGGHHGPNKVVLGIAIALCSIVFLIIFLICLARKCV